MKKTYSFPIPLSPLVPTFLLLHSQNSYHFKKCLLCASNYTKYLRNLSHFIQTTL